MLIKLEVQNQLSTCGVYSTLQLPYFDEKKEMRRRGERERKRERRERKRERGGEKRMHEKEKNLEISSIISH